MIYTRRTLISEGENRLPHTRPERSSVHGFDVVTHRTDISSCVTIRTGELPDAASQKRAGDALGQILKQFEPHGRILAAGIGNPAVTPDSPGPRCIGKLTPSPDTSPALFPVSPGIPASTGLDTADIVKALAGTVHADCIITVDALAAASEDSLGTVIQITDQGTSPGSGTDSAVSGIICRETMGIPVISVGVPTVIESGRMLVTPADCDRIAETYARVIAWGILRALFH
ncbi:MAG: GPR endopeptidase [Clostridia bacterium]|nr:GPR endopeptidase [Clostridia bacterium]